MLNLSEPNMKKLSQKIRRWLPLLLIVAVWLVIFIKNVKWGFYYTGWDNIHAEFDLLRYAKQVFFGAWLEHQGLGAPMGLSHLSEIFRLPILLILKILLPDFLIRYAFIFIYYLIGGVGTYFYLKNFWISSKNRFSDWIASVGAIFYMLHILTLQQFYISFELFMVQFAFLPFLLISVHLLTKKVNIRHTFFFILTQLLIAPSGHTGTLFYLGTLVVLIYAFFINFNKGFIKAFLFSFIIGLITFFSNAYWIVPNLYYGFNNSSYVQESRDNQLFGLESIWSIKDASTWTNFFKGTHYIFSWKDYSFANKDFDFIFNEWADHLTNPFVSIVLLSLGVMTVLGCGLAIFDKKKDKKRWAIILVYLFSISFIWFDLFPTKFIFNKLYQSSSFLEAFRNPFTKLSVIYSFVSVLLFVQFLEFVVDAIVRNKKLVIKEKLVSFLFLAITFLAIIYSVVPSFQGHFISEKLKVKFPPVYWEMFDYLQGRDKDLRVLQLPQTSHAGWEYYDWQFLGENNGYQGLGFYFFGFPQPFLNRDSDRWSETSDFFYHELKYSLDKQDSKQFRLILDKYNVDLIIIDETKIEATRENNSQLDHNLVITAGLLKVWEKDFLTIYERNSIDSEDSLIIPGSITYVSAKTDRVRQDYPYQDQGDYILVEEDLASFIYPFTDLVKHQASNVEFLENNQISLNKEVVEGSYKLTVPSLKSNRYKTPVQIIYKNGAVLVVFPINQIKIGGKIISLPRINNFSFAVSKGHPSITVFFNNQGISLSEGQSVQPVIDLEVGKNVQLSYSFDKNNQLNNLDGGVLDIDWNILGREFERDFQEVSQIEFITTFPYQNLDILKNPTVNCSQPSRGVVETTLEDGNYVYKADQYGVNCSGYAFDYVSSSYSYFLNLVGENIKGRGIKLFINYSDPRIVQEDYLLAGGKFNETISLLELSSDARDQFNLNWETRSFGKDSQDSLSSLILGAFPIKKVSQIKLERLEKDFTSPSKINNNLIVGETKYWLDSIHLVDYQCQNESCFLGIDQAYDDMWLALKLGDWRFFAHHKYNNWANLWTITGKGQMIIFYLPELVSLFSLFILFLFIFYISFKFFRVKKQRARKEYIVKKVKNLLSGKH